MTKRAYWQWAGVMSAGLFLLALVALPAKADGPRRYRFVVTPRQAADIATIAAQHGASVVRWNPDDGSFVLTKRTSNPREVLAGLAADTLVYEAQGDGTVGTPETPPPDPVNQLNFAFDPEDPPPPPDPNSQLNFAFDFGSDSSGYENQIAFQQVNLGNAHSIATGRGIRIGVLDTGVNIFHPALLGRCAWGYNAIDPSQLPLDVAEDGYSSYGVGHGTMVAGIIARLAPEATIVPIKVLHSNGLGAESDVIEGIRWAIHHQVDVLNISFGTPVRSRALERAIQRAKAAGIVIVASAGNEGADVPHYPAALRDVLAVSSVEADNTKSPWASFGEWISLVAPGSGIRSTHGDGYATANGTSFATAFVSAAAALVKDAGEIERAKRVKRILLGTATSVDDVNPAFQGLLGSGLINIEKAARKAD